MRCAQPGKAGPNSGRAGSWPPSPAPRTEVESNSTARATTLPTIPGAHGMPRNCSHRRLELGGRETGKPRCARVFLVVAGRQVVAVEPPVLLPREPGCERPAIHAEGDALEQERHFRPDRIAPLQAVAGEDRLQVAPQLLVDDGPVLPPGTIVPCAGVRRGRSGSRAACR
jgi:hypothetical protein